MGIGSARMGSTHLVASGLVIKEVNYRDSDKMLTILTAERGKLSAVCRGARSQRNVSRAGTQLLTYSEFTFFESRGRLSVDSAEPREQFIGLRSDIVPLALGSYFAEALDCITVNDTPSETLLKTGLNCLYALSKGMKPPGLIKAAFELRAAACSGYLPDLSACQACGEEAPAGSLLDIENGALFCRECFPAGDGAASDNHRFAPLDRSALSAARYILSADPKKFLSFSLEDSSMRLLAGMCEKYLTDKLDKNLYTLGFYKSLE